MTKHKIGTRKEWLAARLELLEAEKALTRRSDDLAQRRQDLPWVRIDKEYRFDTDDGTASLADLFGHRSQLLIYHFMFGPDYQAGCPSCSTIADGFEGSVVHLSNHDVAFHVVSRAPLAKLQGYKQRMGWRFPWASSFGSDFNYDFQVSQTEEQHAAGTGQYNFRPGPGALFSFLKPLIGAGDTKTLDGIANGAVGTDFETFIREAPGVSAFVREDGVVYHTYSGYSRGLDAVWGMYQWLDRAPKGRNEDVPWHRRRDEYDIPLNRQTNKEGAQP